jgi:putative ABC transport system permease protein
MKLSSILRLYRARLRARAVLVQELFAVLGIAVGVALLFASQVASTSLNGSVRALANGIVGQSRLQLVARESSGFDARLLAEVQRIPGVLAAVPVLEERAQLVGPAGSASVDLIAGDPHYAHLAGPLLQDFSATQLARQQALALPTSVAHAVGVPSLGTVTLQVGAISTRVLVGTELGEDEIGGLVHSPVALAPLGYLQRLTGMQGRITRILVRPAAGRDGAVRAALQRLAAGHLNVQPAIADAMFFSEAAGPINQATTLFSAISALVGFMFAYCAMLLTVPLRRGLVRDLRRDGATRWMTIKTLLFDAAVLGVVASLLGLVLGDVLSITLFHSTPGYLSFAFPVGSQRIVDARSIALAVGAGLLASCIGVLTPLRDIFSRPLRSPTTAAAGHGARAQSASHALWLLGGGLACAGVTTAILLSNTVSLAAAIAGIVSLVLALLLLLPLLLGAIVECYDRLQRRLMSGAARLAAIELQSPTTRARSLAIAATGALAVFAGVTSQGATGNLQSGLDRLFADVTSVADVWVATPGNQNLLATTPLLGSNPAALAHLPGVRAVGDYHASFLDYGDRRVWVLAPPLTAANPIPPSQLLRGELAHATALLRGGGWAVLSRVVANQHHLRVGQSFALPAPFPITLRVAALSTNLGWPPGAIVLSPHDYARGWGVTESSAYNVMLQARASPAMVSAEIHRALGTSSGLAVETAAQRDVRQRTASRQGLERLGQISTLVLIAGAMAIAAAMSAMISQRRPQLARMKLEGFPTRGLWRALILESALLLGAGCSIGALFGVYGQLVLSHDLLEVTGFPVIYSVAALDALGSFALVAGAAAAIVAVPGYRAASVRPYPV